MMLAAPGFALISCTVLPESACATKVVGVLAAAGLDDGTGCGTASAPDASRDKAAMRPMTHSVSAVPTIRRLRERFI